MIDVIIPCYNTRKTLPRVLSSIVTQTMIDDIIVTLSDDASTESYDDIVETFSKYVEIKIVRSETNLGPRSR